MNELALFAGAGGGILAGHLLGWRCVCAVEIDEYARRVLLARQDDGALEPFPVWDDIKTFDAVPWRGLVDVVSGGFPCTDISVAGRGAGIDGEASGLWAHMARVVRDVRPRFVFVENSPALTTRGIGRVLGDLAALGYDAEWGVLGADAVGACHRRERMWIVASDTDRESGGGRELQPQGGEPSERERVGDRGCSTSDATQQHGAIDGRTASQHRRGGEDALDSESGGREGRERMAPESRVRRGDDGLAPQLDPRPWREWGVSPTVGKLQDRAARLRCLGNGQVPQCAADAWRQLVARGGWR